MEQILLRLHQKVDKSSSLNFNNELLKKCFRFENALLLDYQVPDVSEQTLFAYFSLKNENLGTKNKLTDYSPWINDKRNLVKNPGITDGELYWTRLKDDESQKVAYHKIPDDEYNVKESLNLFLPKGEKPARIGWTQNIPVLPGHTYMFGGMVRCKDIAKGAAITIIFSETGDKLSKREITTPLVTGTEDWKYISGVFKAPDDTEDARMNLTLAESGTVSFKGLVMMEVIEGYS